MRLAPPLLTPALASVMFLSLVAAGCGKTSAGREADDSDTGPRRSGANDAAFDGASAANDSSDGFVATGSIDASAVDAGDGQAANLWNTTTEPGDSGETGEASDNVDAADGPSESTAGDGGANAAASDDSSTDFGLPADRFVTGVVSFTPGPCAGFGASKMPGIVEGPPHGGGASVGSLDVVSLGVGGEIILSFGPNAIVDGPGPDFIVFENPFDIGGDSTDPYAEPGEVSVSDDGATWTTYPCTATAYPYGSCAGWHPVLSAPGNGISPVDPATAGGDAFDLADLGMARAQFVRIRDKSNEVCAAVGGLTTNGFDLDAISIVHGELP